VACDFIAVDTVFLRRLYALVFVEHRSRVVHLAGITAHPTGEWVTQQARNLVGALRESAPHLRFLIPDRDTKFTASFDEVFRSEGVRIIRTPARAPVGCENSDSARDQALQEHPLACSLGTGAPISPR